MIYILSYSVGLICKFYTLQKILFVTVSFTLLLGAVHLRKTIPSRPENVFTKIYAPNMILIRKTF